MRRIMVFIAAILFLSLTARAQDVPYTPKFPTAPNSAASLGEVRDNARSILAASISSTADTLTLGNASSFPSSGAVTIESEIVFYTGKSGNVLTGLLRGRESTAAKSHAAGVSVEMRIIAAAHNTLSAAIRALETKLGIGSSTPALDKIPLGTGAGQSAWTDHTLNNIKDVIITSGQEGDTLIRDAMGIWRNEQAGSGTVTSVGVVLPGIFNVSGSPVTDDGDITATLANQAAHKTFIGPVSGGDAAPTFRLLDPSDIPELALGTKTSGNYVASVTTAGPLTGGAAGSEGAAISLNCPTCVLSSMAGTANEIASTGGTAPIFSISPTLDLSGKTSTIPFKSGTLAARPGTCVADKEIYNVTNPATPGQSLYVCNAAGTGWNLIGDGGGAGSISSIAGQTGSSQDFAVDNSDPNLVIGIGSAGDIHTFSVTFENILAGDKGGTNNGFMEFSGPAASLKTFTLPNVSSTILTTNDLVAVNQGGTGANSASGARSALGLAIGADIQAFDSDLAALAGNTASGLYARTGAGTGVGRTVGAGSASLVVTNGDGVSGNPSIDTVQNIQTTATPQFARQGLGAAADANHLLLLSLGTITTDKHAIDASATWNAGGVTFTGWKFNVTDTASAAGSLLMDLQVGGVSKFKVDKAGAITVTGCTGCGSGAAPGGSTLTFQYKNGSDFSGAENFTASNNNPRLVGATIPGSPATGEFGYDSVQKTQWIREEGLTLYRGGLMFAQTATKAVGSATAETTMIATGVGATTFPANFFVAGRTVRVYFSGKYASAPSGQNLIRLKLGGTTRLTIDFQPDVTAGGDSYSGYFEFVCRSTGASGSFFGTGYAISTNAATDDSKVGGISGGANFNWSMNTTTTQAIDVTIDAVGSGFSLFDVYTLTVEVVN